jgi:hypothetical protein
MAVISTLKLHELVSTETGCGAGRPRPCAGRAGGRRLGLMVGHTTSMCIFLK